MSKFNVRVALNVIGGLMKENGITHAELHAVFPQRPATEQEFSEVAKWIGQVIQERKVGRVVPQDTKPEWTKTTAPSHLSSPQATVADGYFAIPEGALGFSKPHFFRLKHGSPKGKWAKTQFLTEQASDENYPVRGARKAEVMSWLAQHSDEARALYGTLISRCSRCNRTLTDHDNPYFPMYGPECGGK